MNTTTDDVDNTTTKKTTTSNSNGKLFYLGDLIVTEKMNVLQLKEMVLSEWLSFHSNLPPNNIEIPSSVHHIRLRDGKVINTPHIIY